MRTAACRAFRDTGTRKHSCNSYVLRTRATQKGDHQYATGARVREPVDGSS